MCGKEHVIGCGFEDSIRWFVHTDSEREREREREREMKWFGEMWETVKRENFINWFVSPPRKPSLVEISRTRRQAKRTLFVLSVNHVKTFR